jgi:molybdate transport system substrate-binding protein
MKRLNVLAGLVAAAIVFAPLFGAVSAEAGEVKIFAAASMKNALDGAAKEWKAATGNDVVATYAASSALAKQVEAGAPADIFISADLKWMDYLDTAGMIKHETRQNMFGNALVLVESKDNAKQYEISKDLDLSAMLGSGRLAVGLTESVPAGIYAKKALQTLGLWDSVKDKLAEAENVRAALLLVSRGEAPFGIVYKTDTKADSGVTIAGTFPESSHPPVVYPVAIVKASSEPLAQDFMKFLASEKAGAIFTDQGFTLLSSKG